MTKEKSQIIGKPLVAIDTVGTGINEIVMVLRNYRTYGKDYIYM